MDKNYPIISVIVPIFNTSKYLERCISSIRKQTYEKLDIILVDDGSTDNSGVLCDKYETLDERIRVIHKLNGGLSSARNAGIDISEGEYLTFIDSDDWVENEYIEQLYNDIILYESDISIVGFNEINEDGERSVVCSEGCMSGLEVLNQLIISDKSVYYAVAWNKIYKRELFLTIRYPVGKTNEDEFIAHRLFFLAKKVSTSNSALYNYWRQRPDSIMKQLYDTLEKRYENKYEYMNDRSRFLKEHKLPVLFFKNERIKLSIMMNAIDWLKINKPENIDKWICRFNNDSSRKLWCVPVRNIKVSFKRLLFVMSIRLYIKYVNTISRSK